jgi:hypothetical protein
MKALLVRTIRKSWRLGMIPVLLVLIAVSAIPVFAASFSITVTDLDAITLWPWPTYPPVRVADVALYAPGTLYGATATITSGYAVGDTLATTACGGLTCVYTAPTLTISGAGTATDYANALSNVVFSTTNTGIMTARDVTVEYSIDVTVMPGYFKCVDANHYYYHYSGGDKRWSVARQEALNMRYLGYTGYLVHFANATSTDPGAENACVQAQLGGREAWIGLRGVADGGPFNWVDGPTIDNPYTYTNWGASQPDDGPGQKYVNMHGDGMWYNVLDDADRDYVVEFGNPAEDSGLPKSGTAIVHVLPPPDFGATKVNDANDPVAGQIPFDDPFNWTVTIKNSSLGYADFAAGQVIFRDYLPAGPTYGTPAVQNVVNVTNSGNINCAIAANVLNCTASGATVTLGGTYRGQPAGQFDVTFSITPNLPGWKTNPTGGVCRADPDDQHPWDTAKDCNQDQVYVIPPDLIATKSTSDAKTIPTDTWTWTIKVENQKEGKAHFADGTTILQDDLPNVNATYGTPNVINVTDVTNADKINCTITVDTLTCVAVEGTVTVAGLTGTFEVQFTATATDAGEFANPRAGGICKVDPIGATGVVPEYDAGGPGWWEDNNECTPNPVTVYVAILQRDKNGYAGVEDTYIALHPGPRRPVGHSPELVVRTNEPVFPFWLAGGTASTLISYDLTGQIPPGTTVQSAAQWFYAYERCENSWWWGPGYWFRCKGSPSKATITVRAYQLLRAWLEDEATWWNAMKGVKWARPGANGIGKDRTDAAFATDLWNSLGWKGLDTTAMVRLWNDNPTTNLGTIIKAYGPTDMWYRWYAGRLFRLYSSDYVRDPTLRPNLHIISW